VAAAIPTPSVGGVAPLTPASAPPAGAKPRPGAPPPRAAVDADLLAAHARQVGALLPGGVRGVGV
jgi:hypothetical protein